MPLPCPRSLFIPRFVITLSSCIVCVVSMDILSYFGVSGKLSDEEFMRRLVRDSSQDQVRDLRLALFLKAVENYLADKGSRLVV